MHVVVTEKLRRSMYSVAEYEREKLSFKSLIFIFRLWYPVQGIRRKRNLGNDTC